MATLSQYMLSSAATFSFFLSIGSVCVTFVLETATLTLLKVIRSDALPPHMEAARLQLMQSMSPTMRSKAHGAMLMRSRWDAEKRRMEH